MPAQAAGIQHPGRRNRRPRRAPPQREQPGHRHAAHCIVVEHGAHTTDASGNAPRPLARHGQNERRCRRASQLALRRLQRRGANISGDLLHHRNLQTERRRTLRLHKRRHANCAKGWPNSHIDELMPWAEPHRSAESGMTTRHLQTTLTDDLTLADAQRSKI